MTPDFCLIRFSIRETPSQKFEHTSSDAAAAFFVFASVITTPSMSKVDWNNPEDRKAYFRKKSAEYRETHERPSPSYTAEEYDLFVRSAKKAGVPKKKIARHIKLLGLEAARIGLGEQVERPPQVPEEVIDELQYLLHNCSNNINQIAYNLNSRALEMNVRPVASEQESRRILEELFSLLKETHLDIKSLISTQTKT